MKKKLTIISIFSLIFISIQASGMMATQCIAGGSFFDKDKQKQTTYDNATKSTFDNSFGLTYVSGFQDVVDWYDNEVPLLDTGTVIPVGLSYKLTYNIPNGLRFDFGIGPIALAFGDIEYYDIPLQLTAGYTFIPSSKFRPYLRFGGVYHFVDGDYIEDEPEIGLLGAVGFEFGTRGKISGFIEVSHDTSKATFKYSNNPSEEIEIQSTCATIGISF